MSTSSVRQNYHADCEAAINKQINVELYASYVYQSMAWYFDRPDVAMHGFHRFFSDNSKEERQHAEKFMKYQNERGGTIALQPIDKPAKDNWGSGLEAMQTALDMEKTVNQCILDLHKLASSHDDSHLTNWLESEFIEEQVQEIKRLGEYVTRLSRVGTGLGEHIFDREILGEHHCQ